MVHFPSWFTFPLRSWWRALTSNQVPLAGRYNPSWDLYIHISKIIYLHASKTSKRYIFLGKIVHRALNICPLCSELLVTSGPVWPVRGLGWEGGWGGEWGEKPRASSLHWLAPYNAVNWRLEEWGERERGHIVLLRLSVCLPSHCGNQFAFCRTVDKERKRLPGGLAHRKHQQTQAETKPPLQNNLLCGPSSSTIAGFYLINWEGEQRGAGWTDGDWVSGCVGQGEAPLMLQEVKVWGLLTFKKRLVFFKVF